MQKQNGVKIQFNLALFSFRLYILISISSWEKTGHFLTAAYLLVPWGTSLLASVYTLEAGHPISSTLCLWRSWLVVLCLCWIGLVPHLPCGHVTPVTGSKVSFNFMRYFLRRIRWHNTLHDYPKYSEWGGKKKFGPPQLEVANQYYIPVQVKSKIMREMCYKMAQKSYISDTFHP